MPDTAAINQIRTFEASTQSATLSNTAMTLESSASKPDSDSVTLLADLPNIHSIPSKTWKKILTEEYLDMAELRPESWRLEELLYLQGDPHTTNNCSTR